VTDAHAPSSGPPAAGIDALVGRVLAGRYRILSCLGDGAMGAVYLAEHLRIGRRDAIKVLRPEIAQDAEAIARFARGARNVSSIRHPNVCTIYDFSDAEDGLQYLAMEYVAGVTLKAVLDRERRLEPARAVRIALHIAAALQAAHDAGIVHRDLKPANVMITPQPGGDDEVKVVDFDIAKGPQHNEGEELTRLGFVIGTPEYMSPEQLTGERIDGRSDLYSLGVVLFRMLTGALPFRASSTQEVMVQRLTVKPFRLSDVLPDVEFPPALEDVLERAQALRRDDRYADAAAFSRDLDAILRGIAPVRAGDSAADDVPATMLVSPNSAARPAVTASAATAAAVKRRGLLLAAGLAALAVVAVGATVLLPRLGLERDTAVATPELRETDTADRPEPLAPVGDAGSSGTADPAARPAGNGARGAVDVGGPGAAPGPQGGGSPGDATPVPPPVQPPAPRAEAVADLLERQREVLSTLPQGTRLAAIRDTAQRAWSRSTSRSDSTEAAAILAEAALLARDYAECRRWAQRGASLNPSAFRILLEGCP
jgi:serine/threonine protein kinase